MRALPLAGNATCPTVRCWRNEQCLTHMTTGRPQCYPCHAARECGTESLPRHVCNMDGRLYNNMCALLKASCSAGAAPDPQPRIFCKAGETASLDSWLWNIQSNRHLLITFHFMIHAPVLLLRNWLQLLIKYLLKIYVVLGTMLVIENSQNYCKYASHLAI